MAVAMERIAEEQLRRHWGHTALRPFQREAMAAWASGRDAIVTMATGAGKSLCFQLPPLCSGEGCWSLVVSPLVALMQDQVSALRQRGISAGLFGSGATPGFAASLTGAAEGAFRVVYATPEYAVQHVERLVAVAGRLVLLAVDEAHCISSWGQDFRPTYRDLGSLRRALARVPVICVTATCTQEVRHDIETNLGLRLGFARVSGPMNRPNLKYIIKERTCVAADLGALFGAAVEGLGGEGGVAFAREVAERRALPIDNTVVGPTSSTIVYVSTKARSQEIADWLSCRGVSARPYNAGIGMSERSDTHRAFIMDEVQVVVATIAFGMGIDKPSIRRVVHYGAVRSLEHYVQQCGRAGRDGDEAECVAFIKADKDASEARHLILHDFAHSPGGATHTERMLALHAECAAFLADSAHCRRLRLLQHFGEAPVEWTPPAADAGIEPPRGECILVQSRARCGWCDVCLSGAPEAATSDAPLDLSKECRILLGCIGACGGYSGAALPCAVAAGQATPQVKSRGLEHHASFGSGRHLSPKWWKAFLSQVRQAGFIKEQPARLSSGIAYAAVSVTDRGAAFLRGGAGVAPFELADAPPELAAPFRKPPVVAPVVAAGAGRVANSAPRAPAPLAAPAPQAAPAPVRVRSAAVPASTQEELYRRLVHTRTQYMRRVGVVGECLLSNPVLRRFAELRPSGLEDAHARVEGLPGVLGDETAALLRALLEEIQRFGQENGLSTALGAEAAAAPSVPAPVAPPPAKRALDAESRPAALRLRSCASASAFDALDALAAGAPADARAAPAGAAGVRASMAAPAMAPPIAEFRGVAAPPCPAHVAAGTPPTLSAAPAAEAPPAPQLGRPSLATTGMDPLAGGHAAALATPSLGQPAPVQSAAAHPGICVDEDPRTETDAGGRRRKLPWGGQVGPPAASFFTPLPKVARSVPPEAPREQPLEEPREAQPPPTISEPAPAASGSGQEVVDDWIAALDL